MTCPAGFDPFEPSPLATFEAHLHACAHCAEVTVIAARAKQTWRDAALRDDARSSFRDQRLARMPARRLPRGPLVLVLVLAAVGIVCALHFQPRSKDEPTAMTSRAPAVAVSSPAPVAPAPQPEPEPEVRPSASPTRLVIVNRHGGASTKSLVEGEDLAVERGARLSFGFALGDAPVMDVDGPATLGLEDAELVIRAGSAEIHAIADTAVRTPHARIHGEATTYRVIVDETSTRVERRTGSVVVDHGAASRTLTEATARAVVGRAGFSITTTARPGERADAQWKAALARLERGDRAGAEIELRALAGDRDADPRLRSRATFRAAELALGRGARAIARRELAPLLDDPDAALASDAALLLAAAQESPVERRAVWDHLLARPLPEPYRSHARAQRDAD